MVSAGAEVAEQMRYRVFSETQLTCSVGLGPNTLLAKVASDINKPNGQYVLPAHSSALKEFVQSLSLRKVPGIGKVCHPPLIEAMYDETTDWPASPGHLLGMCSPGAERQHAPKLWTCSLRVLINFFVGTSNSQLNYFAI